MLDKKNRLGLWEAQSIYGYLLGMSVEALAIFALMGIGLLVSILSFYIWQ